MSGYINVYYENIFIVLFVIVLMFEIDMYDGVVQVNIVFFQVFNGSCFDYWFQLFK